jgi:leucyl/phenylalanyl-tRNA--protein transferase
MRTLLNKEKYHVTISTAFEDIIRNCSKLRIDEPGAWLGEDMIKAYTKLHKEGYAESIEVWEGDKLVGGLYGIHLNGCFFGESMFSLVPSASKIALIYLAKLLEKYDEKMIDCQFETPHLKSMGGRYIDYEEYMDILTKSQNKE